MTTTLNFIFLLSMVCWVGSIVFFSFFVAPVIFKNMEREKAGELIGIIFSKYYMIGYICGFIILMVLFLAEAEVGLKWCAWGIMMFGSLSAGLGVNPKVRDIKLKLKENPDAGNPALEARFKTLHSLSVKLNAVVLFSGLWLLWLSAIKF
jgi:hypothetical protein